MNIDVYEYIASNEPRKSQRLIESYGYTIRSRNMAQNLRELVNNEGESAVDSIMKIHPDFEYFVGAEKSSTKLTKKKDIYEHDKYAYLNAIGSQQHQTNQIANQTNVLILAASLFLAVAIISKK